MADVSVGERKTAFGCYYCDKTCYIFTEAINHSVEYHRTEPLKLKIVQLDSNKSKSYTKNFLIIPCELEKENKLVIPNNETLTLKISRKPISPIPLNPQKRRKLHSTPKKLDYLSDEQSEDGNEGDLESSFANISLHDANIEVTMVSTFSKLVLVCVLMQLMIRITEVKGDKRLVLHSDDDVLQTLASLELEIQGMKTELKAKDQAIATLNQTVATMIQAADRRNATLGVLEQELQGVKTELASKTREINTLQQSISQKASAAAIGSTYIRWGRTICGRNSSQLVYKGYATGPFPVEPGNGANMLCLPEHPTWGNIQAGYSGGRIYGAEYSPVFKAFNFQHWEDMPCSVCRTPLSTTIMMPASTQCSAGWTMQYTGYIMSSHYTHSHPSDYICVDEHPEAILHGERDEPGPNLYVVNAKCGTLPCQEYPDGQQLACSVCSK